MVQRWTSFQVDKLRRMCAWQELLGRLDKSMDTAKIWAFFLSIQYILVIHPFPTEDENLKMQLIEDKRLSETLFTISEELSNAMEIELSDRDQACEDTDELSEISLASMSVAQSATVLSKIKSKSKEVLTGFQSRCRALVKEWTSPQQDKITTVFDDLASILADDNEVTSKESWF